VLENSVDHKRSIIILLFLERAISLTESLIMAMLHVAVDTIKFRMS
jgi:hypothetical protein